jgi:hypothetical protein
VLNVAHDQVIYFTGKEGNEVRSVDVKSLEDQHLFILPEGYRAAGQNCITPDGKKFVYIESPIGSKL